MASTDDELIDAELERRNKLRKTVAPNLSRTDLPNERKKPKREDYEDEHSYTKADRAYKRGLQEEALQKR